MARDGRYFKASEYTCKCGCGYCNPSDELIKVCDTIREYVGVALRVSSGCRCANHNARVGGVPNSNHITGHAADLIPTGGLTPSKLWAAIKELHKAGALPQLAGLGRYDTFCHVDTRPKVGRLREWDERKKR